MERWYAGKGVTGRVDDCLKVIVLKFKMFPKIDVASLQNGDILITV